MIAMRQGTRQTSASVEFRHPFRLGADERELPAGVYRIETLEEEHVLHLGSVFVTVGIDFVVRYRGRTSTWMVRPADLRDALARDLEHDAFSYASCDALASQFVRSNTETPTSLGPSTPILGKTA